MAEGSKTQFTGLIQSNIEKHGHHITLVSGGALPRFAYTIGLRPKIGGELIFPGGLYYDAEEVKQIINGVANNLKSPLNVDHLTDLGPLGLFHFRKADPSWVDTLLLGISDFFADSRVPAWQIVPDQAHWTLDIPNLSKPIGATIEAVWQWVNKPWSYPVPPKSVATTNLGALRGGRVTEAMRWEEDQWELFAGAGPDLPREDLRVVPLATLLASDSSLTPVTTLRLNHGLWRGANELEWHAWERKG